MKLAKTFVAELLSTLIISIGLCISKLATPVSIILILVVLVAITLNYYAKLNTKLVAYITALIVPFILYFNLNKLMTILFKQFQNLWILWTIIFIALYAVILVPMIKATYSSIKNLFGRLIIIVATTFALLFESYIKVPNRPVLTNIFHTQVMSVFAIIVASYFIIREWKLPYRLNMKFGKMSKLNILFLVLIVLFSVWYILASSFVQISTNLVDGFFNWDFSLFDFSWLAAVQAVQAGVFEELFRYLILVAIVFAFRNSENLVFVSIIGTAVIFDLMHLSNLMTSSLDNVLIQLVYVLGWGLLAPTLYLYTGQFWLVVVLHFITDFLQFSRSALAMVGNTASLEIILVFTVGIPVVIAVICLASKSIRSTMKQHALALIGVN